MTTESLKCLIFASLISADNDRYTEDLKQEIIARYNNEKGDRSTLSPDINWEYIFEPLGTDAERYIELMKAE